VRLLLSAWSGGCVGSFARNAANVVAAETQIAQFAVAAAFKLAQVFAILHPAIELGTQIDWKAHGDIPLVFIFLPLMSFRFSRFFEKCSYCMAAM
jgi:hypothetical protein